MYSSSRIANIAAGFLIGLLAAQPASAEQPRFAQILMPDATQDNVQCGINNEEIRSAAASVLRQNRYELLNRNHDQKISIVIVPNSLRLSSGCAVDVRVSFGFVSTVRAPWGANYRASVNLCERATLLSGPVSDMAARVRERVISFVEVCISREERDRM